VLSHRAGVPTLPREVLDLDNIADRDLIVRTMCEAEPQWRPGRVVAYHAVSGGFVIAEVLQRVTGVSIRDFLRTEVLEPLGFTWGNYGVNADQIDQVVRCSVTGPWVPPPISTLLERALGLPLEEVTAALNDPRMLTGIAPAVNIVTTAGEHAKFYDMLRMGGEIDGTRVFETATIRRAIAEQNWFEPDLTLGIPMRYSLGFMLGRKVVSFFGPNTEHAFGHNGYTNIVGWADPERRVAAALMTSGTPIIGTHLLDFLAVPREIAHQCPADGLEDSPLHQF
jgi:CubicO group peptidase (beta-lactamase class C family)